MKIKEIEKRDKFLDLARELKITMGREGDRDTNPDWYTWNNLQGTGHKTGRLGNKRTSRDHPDYSIIKIGQNTEKSPGDLRRLAITQNKILIGTLGTISKGLVTRQEDLEIRGQVETIQTTAL